MTWIPIRPHATLAYKLLDPENSDHKWRCVGNCANGYAALVEHEGKTFRVTITPSVTKLTDLPLITYDPLAIDDGFETVLPCGCMDCSVCNVKP